MLVPPHHCHAEMAIDVRAPCALPRALDPLDQLPALPTNPEDKVMHKHLESHGQNAKRVIAKVVDSFLCQPFEAQSREFDFVAPRSVVEHRNQVSHCINVNDQIGYGLPSTAAS